MISSHQHFDTWRFAERYVGRLTAAGFILIAASLTMMPWAWAQPTESIIAPQAVSKPLKTAAHLYFSDTSQRFLSAETRVLVHADNRIDFAKQIIAALIRGPQSGLTQTLPSDARLKAFFLMPDGTAFVDFNESMSVSHPGGCQSERMTVFSVVNSLVLNLPEIRSVHILIDGKPAATLAGHIDIRYALQADMLLIR